MALEGLRAQLDGRHHRVTSYTDDSGTRNYDTACGLHSSYMFGDRKSNHLLEGPPPENDQCLTCFPPPVEEEGNIPLYARLIRRLVGS